MTRKYRKRKEKQKEARSSLQRLATKYCQDSSDAFQQANQEPYEWLPVLTVKEYKKRLQDFRKQRRQEYNDLRHRSQKGKNKKRSYTVVSRSNRWETSQGLARLRECFVKGLPEDDSSTLPSPPPIPPHARDLTIWQYLRQFPKGLTRPQLLMDFDIPRTTMYDALTRLILARLVTRAKQTPKRGGRPPIRFIALARLPPS